jgi:hypothetical protein
MLTLKQRILFILLIGNAVALSAQSWPQFDTLYTSPANPNTGDSIAVIYQFTNNYSVDVDNRQVFTTMNGFAIKVCYRDGLATVVESYRDTVVLPSQPVGTYDLQLFVQRGTWGATNHCTVGNDDIDTTVQFTVSPIFTHTTLLPENAIGISPNPVDDQPLLITAQTAIEQVTCYNKLGQLVREIKTPFTKQLEISLSDLPSGVYYINLQIGGKQQTKKIVKL